MKIVLRYILVFLYFIAPLSGKGQAPQSSIRLSLRHAIQTSLEENGSFAQTKEKEKEADFNISVSRSVYLPNLSAQGALNKQKDAENNPLLIARKNSYNQYSLNLHLNQLLYQHGSLATVSSAEKLRDIALLNTSIARRDLSNNIIQTYFQITLNSRNIRTLTEQRNVVTESLKTAERRQRAGSGRLIDVLQIKTQLALLDGQIVSAQNLLDESRTTLANFLGNSYAQNFIIPDTLEAPSIAELDSLIAKKPAEIPEVQRDDIAISQIDDQRKTLWGQNLPYLNLVGNYAFTSFKDDTLFEQPANSWLIGLQLTIPLFSGLSTVYQNRALLSSQLQLKLERRFIQDQFALQQINSKKNLENAYNSIQTGQIALRLAKESLTEAKKNYLRGTIDYLQYLSIQQQLVVAEQSLNSSKYSYIVAIGNYYASQGQDMMDLVTLLEEKL